MVFDLAGSSTSFGNSTTDHPYLSTLDLSTIASEIFVASPNYLGSLLRIPAAILMKRFSTRTLHLAVMITSSFGTMDLMIMSFATQYMGE